MRIVTLSTRTLILGGIGLSLCAAILAAHPAAPPAPPTRVATVDLQAVFDKLKEKQDWEIRLKSLQQKVEDEVAGRKKKLEDMVAALKTVTEPDKKLAAIEAAQLEKLETEQWAGLKMAELDRETSLMWRQIYKHIREESGRLAEEKGYDYVIVAEPGDDLQVNTGDRRTPQWQQTLQQISQRRILYAAPANNISDELAARMNNANVAGGAAPAATPPKPAAPPARSGKTP